MVRIHPDPPRQTGVREASRARREGPTCRPKLHEAASNEAMQSLSKAEGAVAQLGEHLLCKQGVVGSIPSSSTNAAEIKAKR